MARVKFSVTTKDIEEGRPSSSTKCPVAKALVRQGIPYAKVTVRCIRIYKPTFKDKRILSDFEHSKQFIVRKTPDAVSKRIKTFDETGKMHPFEFWLNI